MRSWGVAMLCPSDNRHTSFLHRGRKPSGFVNVSRTVHGPFSPIPGGGATGAHSADDGSSPVVGKPPLVFAFSAGLVGLTFPGLSQVPPHALIGAGHNPDSFGSDVPSRDLSLWPAPFSRSLPAEPGLSSDCLAQPSFPRLRSFRAPKSAPCGRDIGGFRTGMEHVQVLSGPFSRCDLWQQ